MRVSECPVEIAMSRSAWPESSAIVTKVWRSECGVMRLVTPAALATRPTMRAAPRRSSRVPFLVRSTGPGGSLTDGGADRPGGPVGHRDGLDLAALAGELRRALTSVVAEVVDVEVTGFRDAQPVEPEQADQGVVSCRP